MWPDSYQSYSMFFGQRLRNGQVLVLVLGGEEGRGQVVIASVDHDLEPGYTIRALLTLSSSTCYSHRRGARIGVG